MPKLVDLTGRRFGRLVVIDRAMNRKRRVVWKCLCDCGNEAIVRTDHLRGGYVKSCGCSTRKDITGRRYGRLLALKYDHSNRRGKRVWRCLCDCGNICFVSQHRLSKGHTRSCGCLGIEIAMANNVKNNIKKRILPTEAYKFSANKRRSKYLSPAYVRSQIVQRCGIQTDKVTDEMVYMKRQQLKLHRELKKARRMLNGTD